MNQASAFIHPKAKIGKNVTIDPFTYISGDVVVGDNSWIGPNVTIMDGARIGKNCKIFPGAVVSAIPQDLKYSGEKTTVEIGDGSTIREFVTIHKGTSDRNKTIIGKNTLLMAYVHVAHDAIIGNNCILANGVNVAGHVVVEDYVVLEGWVGVQQFMRVGVHAFVAGASLVRKNVPPFVKAAREPLSYIGVNSIGLKRRGFQDEKIREIEDIYRTIYVHNQNITKALSMVENDFPYSDEKAYILNFIKDSDKGIMRGVFAKVDE